MPRAIDKINRLPQGIAIQIEFGSFELAREFGMDAQGFDEAADRAVDFVARSITDLSSQRRMQ